MLASEQDHQGFYGLEQAVEKACCLEALERERLDKVGKVETSG